MRRIKVGDVFLFKIPNGYKLTQWAYDIPRRGQFLRVFPGLFDSIPNNIENLVREEHSYIIAARIRQLYKIGLAEFLGNYPVPEQYPFPPYNLAVDTDHTGKVYRIFFIRTTPGGPPSESRYSFLASSIEDLPPEFRGIKLLNGYLSPDLLLYLFDCNFDLDHLERYEPRHVLGENCKEKLAEYLQIVETADAMASEKQV